MSNYHETTKKNIARGDLVFEVFLWQHPHRATALMVIWAISVSSAAIYPSMLAEVLG